MNNRQEMFTGGEILCETIKKGLIEKVAFD
jgi:hypothetical protein